MEERITGTDIIMILNDIRRTILEKVGANLHARGAGIRSPSDDNIFLPFNQFTAFYYEEGLLSFCIDLFIKIEKIVNDFETNNDITVHKGAIFFNVAICYFQSGDFDFALYYWDLADKENKLTNPVAQDYNLFKVDPLFKRNFTDKISSFIDKFMSCESNICNILFKQDYTYKSFETSFAHYSLQHLVNIFINLYKLFRYEDMKIDNDAVHTLYYKLVADNCIQFESTIKDYLNVNGVLDAVFSNHLGTTTLQKNITTVYKCLNNQYQKPAFPDYNSKVNTIISHIDSETDQAKLFAKILHLIRITRNQVTHQIDDTCVIYHCRNLSKRLIRLTMIASLFDKYL